jgi:O-antigen/teichoic acid export membrane protein
MKTDQSSLSRKVVGGLGWTYANKMTGRVVSLVRLIVLGRLLAPEDFGLFGIVILATVAIKEFSSTGVELSLIQRKGDDRLAYDAGWTIEFIRGILSALLLYLTSPLIGRFFGEPSVVPLLRVMSITFLLDGSINIGVVFFIKEFQFQKQFVYEVLSSILALIVGIAIAVIYRSVWALVCSELTRFAASVILSYVLHPYRPTLALHWQKIREIFRYGKWVLGTSVTIYIGDHIDNIAVGKILGTSDLGFYAMAFSISLFAIREVTFTISEVALPGYALIQEDMERLKTGFHKIFQYSTFISIPASLGIALIAPSLVSVLLGDKWMPAVLPLQVLMVSQLIKSIGSTGSPLFLGIGRPNYEFHMQAARALTLLIFIVPFTSRFGLPGAAFAVVLSSIVMVILFLVRVTGTGVVKARGIVVMLLPTIFCALIMSSVVLLATRHLAFANASRTAAILELGGTVFLGALAYVAAAFLVSRFYRSFTVPTDLLNLAVTALRK